MVSWSKVITSSDGANDGYVSDDPWSLNKDATTLWARSTLEVVLLRFMFAPFPQDATILSAPLTVHKAGNGDGFTVRAVDADTTSTPTQSVKDMPRTDASVTATGGATLPDGAAWTVDVAPVLAELVRRPGWAPGNHFTLVLEGDPADPVRLYASENGNTTRPAITVEYAENQPPTAALTVTVGSGDSWAQVTADTTGSADPDGDPITRRIDWGDGYPPATTEVATHTYARPGTYTVTGTVTDNRGATATAEATVTVQPSAVHAAFTATVEGRTVTVADGSFPPPGGALNTWVWAWGDGTTTLGVGPDETHTYPAVGDYTITLTVTDTTGTTGTTTVPVTTTLLTDQRGPIFRAALGGDTRTVSAMVDIIDDTDTVLATLGGPTGGSPGLVAGAVVCDSTRRVRWTCDLTVTDPDLVPTDVTDLLHPLARNRARIWWLLRLPDGTWGRVCVGTYVLSHPDVRYDGQLTMGFHGDDVAAEVTRPYTTRVPDVAGLPNHEAIAAIWAHTAPYAPTRVTPTGYTLPTDYTLGGPGDNPWDDVEKIAQAAGMVAYADRYGVLTLEPAPPAGSPVAQFVEGPGCTMTDLSTTVDLGGLANDVLVYSTSSDVNPPVHATATDEDPASPLWVGHGRRYPKVVDSAEVTTYAQALTVAQTELAAARTMLERLEVVHRPDPTLDPGQVVAVAAAAPRVSGMYRVQGWDLALGPGAGQRTTMAERGVSL